MSLAKQFMYFIGWLNKKHVKILERIYINIIIIAIVAAFSSVIGYVVLLVQCPRLWLQIVMGVFALLCLINFIIFITNDKEIAAVGDAVDNYVDSFVKKCSKFYIDNVSKV